MPCFIHMITKEVQLSVPASKQLPPLWVNVGSPENLPLDIPKRYWRVNKEAGKVEYTQDPQEMAEEDAIYLQTLKARKVEEVEGWFLDDLNDLYPLHRQQYIMDEVKEAREDGLVNRVEYLRRYRPWYKAGLKILKELVTAIEAATEIEQITSEDEMTAIVPEDPFREWRQADPKIFVFEAEAIED